MSKPSERPRGSSPSRETELKLQLACESSAQALLAVLPGGAHLARPEQVQTNHYFDTADGALLAVRGSLRLREAGGTWTITAKGPPDAAAGADPALASRAEEECVVEAPRAAEILAGNRCPLATLLAARGAARAPLTAHLQAVVAGRPLRPLGSFTNRRAFVGPIAVELGGRPRELTLELDRTTFPGDRVEWELELEVAADDAAPAAALLASWFRRAGLPWLPAANKLQRFLAHRDPLDRGPTAGTAGSNPTP